MRVFVTGATGWVGSAVVKDLLAHGHEPVGLARPGAKAEGVKAAGAAVLEGTLDDHDVLHRGAAEADAVVHTAFNHDFSNFAAGCEQDRRAIETLGHALKGSARPLLVTSGLAGLVPDRPVLETDLAPADPPSPRRSEQAAQALAAQGVRTATVRLASSVHGLGDHGFVPILIALARRTGVSAFPGDGFNAWSGAYRDDAARVYRLALETGVTASVYHATADEAVPIRDIAAVIGRRLGLPVESRPPEHFGWFGMFVGANIAGSSEATRALLGWAPTGPDLLSDLDQPGYYPD